MRMQITNDRDGEWRTWFAWHPVDTPGSIVWLIEVERRWNENLGSCADFSGYSYSDGGWEYRESP